MSKTHYKQPIRLHSPRPSVLKIARDQSQLLASQIDARQINKLSACRSRHPSGTLQHGPSAYSLARIFNRLLAEWDSLGRKRSEPVNGRSADMQPILGEERVDGRHGSLPSSRGEI